MSRNMIKKYLGSAIPKRNCKLSGCVCISPHSRLTKYRSLSLLIVTALLGCMLTHVGCGKKDLHDLLSKTKEGLDEAAKKADAEISKAMGTATEQLGMSGKASIQLDQPVVTNACYASFIEQLPDRPNVLKMQSYASSESESFPSIFIQAQVSNASLAELVGKNVSAQVFVQAKQDGELWYTDPADLIQVKISGLEKNKLTAELVDGKLHSTVSGNSVKAAGSIEAIVQ